MYYTHSTSCHASEASLTLVPSEFLMETSPSFWQERLQFPTERRLGPRVERTGWTGQEEEIWPHTLCSFSRNSTLFSVYHTHTHSIYIIHFENVCSGTKIPCTSHTSAGNVSLFGTGTYLFKPTLAIFNTEPDHIHTYQMSQAHPQCCHWSTWWPACCPQGT